MTQQRRGGPSAAIVSVYNISVSFFLFSFDERVLLRKGIAGVDALRIENAESIIR